VAELWIFVKAEAVAGAQAFGTEAEAFAAAEAKTIADGEPRALVRVVATIERDPRPPVVVTRYE
jgi:hypothetical protein